MSGDKRPTGMRVEFYKDVQKKWRWTQYAKNGKVRAASEEGFERRPDCEANWREGYQEAAELDANGPVYVRRDDGARMEI